MSFYIASRLPMCDQCFVCAECRRVVCGAFETVLCACTDEPWCDDCCEREHGGAS